MNCIGRVIIGATLVLSLFVGQAIAGGHTEDEKMAKATLENFQSKDSSLADVMSDVVGYVVFPEIQKAAVLVGGAHGKGIVYEGGEVIGSATVTQGTIGLQAGAQIYSQLMLFKTQEAFDRFKENKWAWHGEATAVATTKGAAATTEFKDGVAIFITDQDGVMASLSVGGQKFEFTPM
jgi:lipid-binding SYLF domain-containing protein